MPSWQDLFSRLATKALPGYRLRERLTQAHFSLLKSNQLACQKGQIASQRALAQTNL